MQLQDSEPHGKDVVQVRFVAPPFGRTPDEEYLFTGVRPSSAAAISARSSASGVSVDACCSSVSAPEDGRTPLKTYRVEDRPDLRSSAATEDAGQGGRFGSTSLMTMSKTTSPGLMLYPLFAK